MCLPLASSTAPLFASLLSSGVLSLACLAWLVGAGFWVVQRKRTHKLREDYKKLRVDLTRANELSAALRGEKSQLLRLLRQEVQEPLDDCTALAAELTTQGLAGRAAETLEALERRLARARQGTAALTELQALDERSRSVILRAVNVGAVLAEAVTHVQDAAARKGVRISLPSPDRGTTAQADIELLRRVLGALLTDAIEVTPAGRAVSLSVYPAKDRVLITVSDEGPGTVVSDPAQVLSESGNSRPPMAAGSARLNLGMVLNLVKAMDGWFWTQGEPGGGTTHVIELALAPLEPVKTPEPVALSAT